jgi:hypothetical protein
MFPLNALEKRNNHTEISEEKGPGPFSSNKSEDAGFRLMPKNDKKR